MHVRVITVLAALSAALAIALGAYAAHGLVDRIVGLGYEGNVPQRVAWFETGARYQLYHALGAMLLVALSEKVISQKTTLYSAVAFFLGTFFFSGSLYTMALAPATWKKLGAVTPVGGLLFLAGWIILAVGASRYRS